MKYGFCKHCGNVVQINADENEPQSVWDEIATDMCGCSPKKKEVKMHKERLTLASLCGGAVQEKMDRALEKVAKNILDPNVVPDKKRTVTLKLTFKPSDEDQEDVMVSADIQTSLAPEIGVTTSFYVAKDIDTGSVSIMEHRRGEIKGQLDFSDVGLYEEDFDPDTGEIKTKDVLDFRAVREG